MRMRSWLIAVTLSPAFTITNASATHNGADSRNDPPGPPQEAHSVCEGKTTGTPVQIATRHATSLDRTCQLMFSPAHLSVPPSGHNKNEQHSLR